MRALPKLLIGGAAALAIAGVATAAFRNIHMMIVRLPGGGVEKVFYTGDTPPLVAYGDMAALTEQVSADMDQETAAMLSEADAMISDPLATATLIAPDRLMQANLGEVAGLPAGARGYSFVSTVSGGGVCSRTVEITSRGDGVPPTVVTHTSGNCAGASADHPAAPTLDTPAIARPHLTEATWRPAPSAKPRLQPVNAVAD